jgi:hypothetical protein
MEFGDIVFYSIGSLVLLLLIWLWFIETFIPLWGAWAVWIALTIFLISQYEGFKKKRRARHGKGSLKGSVEKIR